VPRISVFEVAPVNRPVFDPLSPAVRSVSNGSGLPGFGPGWNRTEGPGPGWNRTEGPGPGQEPPSNPNHFVLAGLLPGPDINPRFHGRVEPGLRFHFTVPTPFAPIKYLSSDCIVK